MEEWKEYKLGDLCTELSDGLHKAPKFVNGGDYIFVNAKNISNGFVVDNDPTKKSDYEEYLKYSSPLNETTVLYSIDGTIGNIALYRGEKCILGKGACYMNPNPALLDRMYLYYELQAPHFKLYIDKMSTGSTIKHISLKTMRNYEMKVPSIKTQQQLVSILKSLDDKIEVNRRINENLEQQAQALFKSWFVDFEPFRDQPFVESELGMIPQGWRVQEAQEVFSINIGKTPPRKESEWFSESNEDNVWVSIADMGFCGTFISDSSEYLTDEAVKRFNIQMVEKNSILLSFKLTVGRVAIADTRLTTNEAIARFILPKKLYSEFLYLYLKQYKYGNLGSTSSIATAVNSKTIKGMKLLIPNAEVIESFSKNTRPLFEQIRTIQQESRRLAESRDTLLPKLMSGELNVENVNF